MLRTLIASLRGCLPILNNARWEKIVCKTVVCQSTGFRIFHHVFKQCLSKSHGNPSFNLSGQKHRIDSLSAIMNRNIFTKIYSSIPWLYLSWLNLFEKSIEKAIISIIVTAPTISSLYFSVMYSIVKLAAKVRNIVQGRKT